MKIEITIDKYIRSWTPKFRRIKNYSGLKSRGKDFIEFQFLFFYVWIHKFDYVKKDWVF